MAIIRASLISIGIGVAQERIHIGWDLKKVTQAMNGQARVFSAIDKMVDTVKQEVKEGDHILVMSNGAFGGIHEKLIKVLEERQP